MRGKVEEEWEETECVHHDMKILSFCGETKMMYVIG